MVAFSSFSLLAIGFFSRLWARFTTLAGKVFFLPLPQNNPFLLFGSARWIILPPPQSFPQKPTPRLHSFVCLISVLAYPDSLSSCWFGVNRLSFAKRELSPPHFSCNTTAVS